MLLCIDIGNTNVTLGLYQGERLAHHWRLATVQERMPDEYGLQLLGLLAHAGLAGAVVTHAALASVVPPLTAGWVELCRTYLGCDPLVIDGRVDLGVPVLYDPPHAVGADRLVNAVAVLQLYGGPACVVDFGTGTTFDAISAQGEYLGGAIAPGIGIAAHALFQRAAKLPRVEISRPPNPIGRNTPHALQSGLFFGYVGLVEGMVARFRTELGPTMKVIATGGLAELFASETQVIQILAPWLTLDGLRMIHDRAVAPQE